MLWTIPEFPKSKYHTFLSHCAADRDSLIFPVYRGLKAQGFTPWIDRHDYAYGRPSRMSLRDGLLNCRHVVFFITDAFLTQPRGWCAMELAWTELIQDNLVVSGGHLVNVFLPLIFVEQSDLKLPRSIWQVTRDRAVFWDRKTPAVEWSVNQISQFLNREREQARKYARYLRNNENLRSQLKATGQYARVTRFDPTLIANIS